MPVQLDKLLQEIQELEKRITQELKARREEFHYHLEKGKVTFEKEVRRQHRRVKTGILRYLRDASLLNILTAPVIYSLIAPALVIDLWVQMYQAVCFPAYGIPRVVRRDFFALDHRKLSYLNAIEKFNCIYCSYFNGLVGFIREVGSRTEQYWCPIRHSRSNLYRSTRDKHYFDYGDAETFKRSYEAKRRQFEDIVKNDDDTP